MSSSEKQLNALRDRWWWLIEPILSEFTSLDNFSKAQVSSTFWTAMIGVKFEDVFEELLEGYQIFIQDNWGVDLPLFLTEQHEYAGDVVIDLAGTRTPIRLGEFALVAKAAAIFYAKHFKHQFDPSAYLEGVDRLVEKYRV